jgi:ABC-type transport system substrate-binding protein
LERPIISEYSTRLAQFRAGEIYTNVALAQDIIQTKKDVPETSIREAAAYSTSIWHGMSFGYEGDSPFKDARVRQAVSMLVDGDAYVDVTDNREAFSTAGLDLDTAFNTVVAAGWGDFWLDPTDGAKFGENAKYLGFNVEEAKSLLSAAGYPDGFDFDMYFSTGLYGPVYLQGVDLVSGMLFEGGLRATQRGFAYEQFKDIYYEAYYGPSFASGKTSGFNGMVYLANPPLPTVTSHLFTFVHKDGGRYHGMTPTGTDAHLGDPKLNDDIAKLKLEFERDGQITMVHDIIRYFTGQSYYIPRKAQTKLVSLIWPALSNFDVFQLSPGQNQWSESNLHWWIDDTKAPLA